MAEIDIPHFDLPFRIVANHHPRVVEQDSEDDVTNCVHACLRTRRGFRFYVPIFGISDPTFENAPVDLATIEQEVAQNEPRARMILNQTVETVADLIQVQVGVDIG